jgi:DNA-directed RNA polymerase subunit M/transcription elongation factor TFIIS
MPDLKLTCDNCGSMFVLSYEEDEVSYAPSHCPFCGDFYDNESEELNFNDDENDYLDEQEDITNRLDDEEDDYSRH